MPTSTDDPPPFEDPFNADDVEQRIYGTILQTRNPVTTDDIADRAGGDPKTARKYLEWFADLNIVIRDQDVLRNSSETTPPSNGDGWIGSPGKTR